jgi:glutaredoxin 3
MFATRWCPYCIAARDLLGSLGVPFEEIDVTGNRELRNEMERASGRQTVPQIWIGERHVGGFDDLDALHRRGLLLPLLDEASCSAATGNG